MSEITLMKPLPNPQILALRVSHCIQPTLVVEACRIHDQRIALPTTDRIAHPRRLRVNGKLAAIRVNLAIRVAPFIEHRDHHRRLNDLKRKIIVELTARNALRNTARRWTFSISTLRVFLEIDHLRANIEEFIERYYSRCRLHSALGYQSPEEFEKAAQADTGSMAATMSFFRHREIYRADRKRNKSRKPTGVGFPAHRFDESPAGYSLAGCSPEPTSASPADGDIKEEESV